MTTIFSTDLPSKNTLKNIMISTWNYLDIDCKSTAEPDEFKILLKRKFLSSYNSEPDCDANCFVCNN